VTAKLFKALAPGGLVALCLLASSCGGGSGRCTAPLESFGCEQTFAAQKSKDVGVPQRAGPCGPYQVVALLSPGGSFCLYDGRSGALVGAGGGSDLPSFCGGTSDTVSGGVDVNPWDLCSLDDLAPVMMSAP